jgi:hypothetical protein
MSTYSPRTPTHTKNGKKGEHIQCFGCKEILEENHAGQINKNLSNNFY